MNRYCRTHLSDPELLEQLRARVQRDWAHSAEMLADLAEVEERTLYAPAGYPTLHDYCVGELHMSEDVANKRIRAARVARRFPAIFFMVADGRLHLSGVLLLGSYLTPENAKGLLEAAAYKSKREIEKLLAARFPKSDVLTLATPAPANFVPAPSPVNSLSPVSTPLSPETAIAPTPAPACTARVTPLSSGSSSLQLTMPREMEEMLEHLKALVSHRIPSGDVVEVLSHALRVAIQHEEKHKFAATNKGLRAHRPSHDPRYIPMHVKSAVWLRDGGQCTFVSESGKRCQSCRLLEFDHIVEVARGGGSMVENIRLRCRHHNQYTAEQTFGAAFMKEKRKDARRVAAEKRAKAEPDPQRCAVEEQEARDVTPWLRALGYAAEQIRRAVAQCGDVPEETPLQERVKAALRHLMPPHRHVAAVPVTESRGPELAPAWQGAG